MIQRIPLRKQVGEEIRDRILSGELEPGTRFSEATLSKSLGISRTPLREALMDLEHNGLLTSEMGKGFAVAPLSVAEVDQILPILATLHGLGLRLSGACSEEQLSKLESLNDRMVLEVDKPAALYELDREWHALLIESCPNKELLDIIQFLDFRIMRYDLAYWRSAGNVHISVIEHHMILEALGNGELERAAELLVQNWMSAAGPLKSWLNGENGSMADDSA